MKYLNRFNESTFPAFNDEIINEIKGNIEDILLELEDMDFETYVVIKNTSQIQISINKINDPSFYWVEVKDVLIRLCEYYYSIIHQTSQTRIRLSAPSKESPFRMFDQSFKELGVFYKEDYFDQINDGRKFNKIRILIKI